MRFIIILLMALGGQRAMAAYPCLPAPGSFVRCLPSSGLLLTNQQETRYSELTANGTDYVSIKAPASLAAPYALILPPDVGTVGQVLQTDGVDTLSWATSSTPSIGGALIGATLGSILFAGSGTIEENNADFFWKDSNSRMGLGTTVPAARLNIVTSSAAKGLQIDQSGTANGLNILQSGSSGDALNIAVSGADKSALRIVQETGEVGINIDSSNAVGRGQAGLQITYDGTNAAIVAEAIEGKGLYLVTDAANVDESVFIQNDADLASSLILRTSNVLNTADTIQFQNPPLNTIGIKVPLTGVTNYSMTLPATVAASSGLPLLSTTGGFLSWAQLSLATGVTNVLPIANGGSNKALTLAAGGLVWTDADSFEVGAAGTASQWALSGGTGAPTFSNTTTKGKYIDGSADEVQLKLEGHSTQTNNILQIQNSAAGSLLTVDNNATLTVEGSIVDNGSGGIGGNVPHELAHVSNVVSTSSTCTVACSATQVLTGGGCSNSDDSIPNVNSYPSDDLTWTCKYLTAVGDCTAWGICFQY